MKRIFSFLVSCLSCIAALNAANWSIFESGELTCGLVTSLCQDAKGFVWIGTEYGLNKFDGVKFSQFIHNDSDSGSILSNMVRKLYVDKDSNMWVGLSNGLQLYSPESETFRSVPFHDGLAPSVTDIIELSDGELWVATDGRGVFKLDRDNWVMTELKYINENCGGYVIKSIFEDQYGRRWLSVREKGVVCLNKDNNKIMSFSKKDITGSNPGKIIADNDGTIYIGVSGLILMFDESSESFVRIPEENGMKLDIRDIIKLKSGKIFVGTYKNGVYTIDKHRNILISETSFANEIASPKIVAMMEDRSENIWLGYFNKGVALRRNSPLNFSFWKIPSKDEREGHSVTSVYYAQDNDDILIGIENEGLYCITERGETIAHTLNGQTVISIFQDSNNDYWIGTYYDGVAMWNRQTDELYYLPDVKSMRIKSIIEDKQKNLYISTFGTGIKVYNLSTGKLSDLTEITLGEGLKNRWVNILYCDSKGLIWMGHYKGVSYYDPNNKKFIGLPSHKTLDSSITYAILEDEYGKIWVGTNNGIFVFDIENGKCERISIENGLSNNVICGLAKDCDGNIWCSTYRGINKIDIKSREITPFYTGNGLNDKGYVCGIYSHNIGKPVIFGGASGVTYFRPENISHEEFESDIVITNLYVDNQRVTMRSRDGKDSIINTPIYDSDKIKLAYDNGSFTIELSTLDFRNPESICYEYRLSEANTEWMRTLPGENRITFGHLSHGKHTLEIRAQENGIYSPVKQIDIIVTPPWYFCWWAFVCYTIILIGIILYGSLQLKRRREDEIKEEKLRFFINISHEIRSPMTLIINPLEQLLKQKHDDATNKALASMYKNATRIITLINQLLDIRRIDKGQMQIKCVETDMVQFIADVVQAYEYQAEKQEIKLCFEHEDNDFYAWIDRNNFDKILFNLLSNAFKYTPHGGEIKIQLTGIYSNESLDSIPEGLRICVTDTGKGIDSNKLDKVFDRFYQGDVGTHMPLGFGIGLNLCKLLVELHHGNITASNRSDGSGCKMVIEIPTGNHHLREEQIMREPTTVGMTINHDNSLFFNDDSLIVTATNKRNSNYKVLVIDDDEDVRDFICNELKANYRIITVANGEDGFQSALSENPDVIISDVMMPGIDGFALLRKLKGNISTNHIPVVLLTSKSDISDKMIGIEKGADAYLTKPFIVEELKAIVGNLISNRRLLKGKYSGAQEQNDKIVDIDVKSDSEILMERMMNIINAHIDDSNLSVEMLAEQVGLSRVHLHRKIKEMTGIPVSEFIRNIRLKQAARLLRDKKMNVSQVAYAVGFVNHAHFSTVFKKYYGVSPTCYSEQDSDVDVDKRSSESSLETD